MRITFKGAVRNNYKET